MKTQEFRQQIYSTSNGNNEELEIIEELKQVLYNTMNHKLYNDSLYFEKNAYSSKIDSMTFKYKLINTNYIVKTFVVVINNIIEDFELSGYVAFCIDTDHTDFTSFSDNDIKFSTINGIEITINILFQFE